MQCLYLSDPQAAKRRCTAPVNGTCTWIQNHPKFQQWLSVGENPILWLCGGPGVGKSVLSSFLIDNLPSMLPDQIQLNQQVHYFFVDEKIPTQNTATAIIRGLLHQLLEANRSLMKYVVMFYETRGKSLVEEVDILWKIFNLSFLHDPASSPIFLIDSLDECEREGCIDFLMHLIDARNCGSNAKFLVTSRPQNWISDQLKGSSLILNLDEGDGLVARSLDHDIKKVIEREISKMPALDMWSATRKTSLQNRLIRNADKTFLWISLILKIIPDSTSLSTADFEKILARLPDTLNAVYKQMLSKVPIAGRSVATKILTIIIVAREPLTLQQLNECLAIHESQGPFFIDHLQFDMERTLIGLCGNFVRIIAGECHFVHQSAKDFLLQTDLVLEDWTFSARIAHAHMAMNCILFVQSEAARDLDTQPNLISRTFIPQNLTQQVSARCERYPFLAYAIRWWSHHTHKAQLLGFVGASDGIDADILLKLGDLIPHSFKENWLLQKIWCGRMIRLTHENSAGSVVLSSAASVVFCAYHGHVSVMYDLLGKYLHPKSINHKLSVTGLSALHAAVVGKQYDMLEWLISHGAALESRDKWQRTPLHLAAVRNDLQILRLLLDKGADFDAQDMFGLTPVDRAKSHGLDDSVSMLDMWSLGKQNRTLLLKTVKKVVKISQR